MSWGIDSLPRIFLLKTQPELHPCAGKGVDPGMEPVPALRVLFLQKPNLSFISLMGTGRVQAATTNFLRITIPPKTCLSFIPATGKGWIQGNHRQLPQARLIRDNPLLDP